MRKNIFIHILLILVCVLDTPLRAQNSVENETLISSPESSYLDVMYKNIKLKEHSSSPISSSYEPYDMNPFSTPAKLFKNNTVLWNYNSQNTKKLSKQFSLTSYGQQVKALGLGDYNNMGANFKWSPSKSLFSLDAGGFVGTQHGYMFFSQQTLLGANLNLNYEISPKFQLSLKGQYVNSSNINPFLFQNNFFLNTNVGLFAEYRPSKNLSLGFGLLYLYEEMKKNWSLQGGIRVTFYF